MSRMLVSHADVADLAAGYVLGALEPAEEDAVREHLRTCNEPHPELEQLGGVVPYLAEAGDLELVEPPAELRDRIMAAAADERPADQRPADQQPVRAAIPFPSASERETRRARRGGASPLGWAMAIAAVIAIVSLAGWNVLLQQELGRTRVYDDAVAAVLDAAGRPGSQTVVLTATDGSSGSGLAAVRGDGSVVLAVRDLAATTGSQVYETWVIVGESAPFPIGGFTVDQSGTGIISSEPTDALPGSIIALSLEPGPGSTAPIGPVVVSGVATAPSS